MRHCWAVFRPRDTVFVRDGRSFRAAEDYAADAVRPWPSTVAGALRAALGNRDPNPDEVRGPILTFMKRGVDLYFPAPADLVADPRYVVEEEGWANPCVHRLELERSLGRTDLADAPEAWLVPPKGLEKPETLPYWMPADQLAAYLAGLEVGPDGTSVGKLGPVTRDRLVPEHRIGIARNEQRSVREGYFYRMTHFRPEDDWTFAVQYVVPDDWDREPHGPVPFGGRNRLADVEPVEVPGWPGDPEAIRDGHVLIYVATPAIWPTGWRFPVPQDARLIAAAVGDPLPVATSSPRNGWRDSRALRWAVPAGSVYLLEFDDVARARSWAQTWHGRAYGPDLEDPTRTAGFGVILTGTW